MRSLSAIEADRTRTRSKISDMTAEGDAIVARAGSLETLDAGQKERIARLSTGIEKAQADLETFDGEARAVLSDGVAAGRYSYEHSEDLAPSGGDRGAAVRTSAERSAALRAVEKLTKTTELNAAGADRLETVIRDESDHSALGARYIAATANPAYKRAFFQALASPQLAPLELSNEEREAFRAVRSIMSERAMSLTTTAGGFAVPYDLDPSIILTNNGVIDPLRAISRIVPTITDTWQGVSSTGITAGFAAEATEAGDNAPTLAQPQISTEKAYAFVPFSIEIGMDWASFGSELFNALADAKTITEGTAFTNGSGTWAPQGVLVGGTAFINTAGTAAFVSADVYSLSEALPARYRARARFAASNFIFNKMAQMETTNGALLFPGLQSPTPTLLNKPFHEISNMSATLATGTTIAIAGDFSRYYIVDRLGLTVELIPHLFATANNRPSGQRGLYAYWRVGAGVVDANAFRRLVTL